MTLVSFENGGDTLAEHIWPLDFAYESISRVRARRNIVYTGDQNDGKGWVLCLELLGEFSSIHTRHQVIGKDQVKRSRTGELQSFFSRSRGNYLVAGLFKDELSQHERVTFIIHAQNHRSAVSHK